MTTAARCPEHPVCVLSCATCRARPVRGGEFSNRDLRLAQVRDDLDAGPVPLRDRLVIAAISAAAALPVAALAVALPEASPLGWVVALAVLGFSTNRRRWHAGLRFMMRFSALDGACLPVVLGTLPIGWVAHALEGDALRWPLPSAMALVVAGASGLMAAALLRRPLGGDRHRLGT